MIFYDLVFFPNVIITNGHISRMTWCFGFRLHHGTTVDGAEVWCPGMRQCLLVPGGPLASGWFLLVVRFRMIASGPLVNVYVIK